MRIYAISDLHLEYSENLYWLNQISKFDYQNDILIVAGDISDSLDLIKLAFDELIHRFAHVLFVPGNHDLWLRHNKVKDSFDKLRLIREIAKQFGIHMTSLQLRDISIYPLFSWYDYSFGQPTPALDMIWMDYRYCHWPENYTANHITQFFLELNHGYISTNNAKKVITFSHFLPRIDLFPNYIAARHRILLPVMGTISLEFQLRQLKSSIHVYGHHHFNCEVKLDGIKYINNALGIPTESHYLARKLICIYETKK